MSVYVENYKHDIFVSYALVDNEPFAGADKGWVTTLVSGLKILLGKKLGRPDAFSLWMDYELRGHTSVTAHTIEQLESSATFVLILSPAYLASQWCRLELNAFLTQFGTDSGRLFVIEHDQTERPAELADLLGYKFWLADDAGHPRTLAIPKPNPEEFQYYQRLDDLARQLTDKLKTLRQAESDRPNYRANSARSLSNGENSRLLETPQFPSEAAFGNDSASYLIPENREATLAATTDAPTIFLAEVSADLEEQRQDIKHSLLQQGVRILPDKAYSFATIAQQLQQDLTQCRLFVQLLSDKTANGYPQFQYERAQSAQLAIFQWRNPSLELAAVTDFSHRALLSQSTVIATDLMEFQTYILKQLQPKPANPVFDTDTDALVFVNAAPEDMSLAHQIKDILEANGIGYSLPLEMSSYTKPADIRQYLEQNILSCDAIIVLYDNTSVVWVNEQILYCRRMQRRRDQPLKIIAVYNTPVANKPPLNMKLPNMQILDCPSPQVETCLPILFRYLQT